MHPNQTAGSDQPFTVTGTSRKSYDYDCNGAEESTVGAISPCNTNATGWANGEVCSTSYHLGNRCSSGSVYDGGIVMTCGSNYFECKYAAGTIQPTWTVKGKIPCR